MGRRLKESLSAVEVEASEPSAGLVAVWTRVESMAIRVVYVISCVMVLQSDEKKGNGVAVQGVVVCKVCSRLLNVVCSTYGEQTRLKA